MEILPHATLFFNNKLKGGGAFLRYPKGIAVSCTILMKRLQSTKLLIIFMLLLWGCAIPQPVPYIINESNLLERNLEAGRELVKKSQGKVDKERPIITASFVNLDKLSVSSSFGRISSQQVASQFTTAGYHVVEMLLRRDVYIKQDEGEFLLSRELKDISLRHQAQAVLVGTYVAGDYYIYVTTKLIDAINSRIISSHAYKIPATKDARILVGN